MQSFDAAIAGAGIIGLSIALELRRNGLSVAVFDKGEPVKEATFAAGGMLAAHDRENPPALLPLSLHSLGLYPEYLDHIAEASGIRVPYRTSQTLQQIHTAQPGEDLPAPPQAAQLLSSQAATERHWELIDEHSIDPRELSQALLAACRHSGIEIHSHTPVGQVSFQNGTWQTGSIAARTLILSTGAWSTIEPLPVFPRKGHMLAVQLSPGTLDLVVRTPSLYLIPRGEGRTVIGATVEDAGFDKQIHDTAIDRLKDDAAVLLPAIADAPILERWTGLRPATADELPLLGPIPGHARLIAATGHYRNGILLAPGTARLTAQQVLGKTPDLGLEPFAVHRTAAAIFAHRS